MDNQAYPSGMPDCFLRKFEEVHFVPSIAVGELYDGAWKSQRRRENVAQVGELVTESLILSCNTEMAGWYGEIKNALRLKGRPIPENDLWIAAIALENDWVVVMWNAHFGELDNLKVEMCLNL